MNRTIEMVISPKGEITLQTKGFVGSDCLAASKFLEQALGAVAGERKTGEFFQATDARQNVQQ